MDKRFATTVRDVQVVAGNIDAGFDVYCSFAVLLAFNRLAAVVFPVRYKSLFGHGSLKVGFRVANNPA